MWHVHLKGEADNKSKGMSTKKKHKSNTPCPHIQIIEKGNIFGNQHHLSHRNYFILRLNRVFEDYYFNNKNKKYYLNIFLNKKYFKKTIFTTSFTLEL